MINVIKLDIKSRPMTEKGVHASTDEIQMLSAPELMVLMLSFFILNIYYDYIVLLLGEY